MFLSYPQWLAALALAFIALERRWPRVAHQPLLRRGWLTDSFYLLFNSRIGALFGGFLAATWLAGFERGMGPGWLMHCSWPTQFALLLVTIDFLKWVIHNGLHRVPWLWEFHKIHHSIVEMDWLGNWRFDWAEILVYNALLYLPSAILGAVPEVALAVGVVDTAVGHFAHSNISWKVGWLRYLINSPEMHRWHHNHPECGPADRNFALTLSVWDWIFRTAYVQPLAPTRFGFEGIESYPSTVAGHWAAPFRALLGRLGK